MSDDFKSKAITTDAVGTNAGCDRCGRSPDRDEACVCKDIWTVDTKEATSPEAQTVAPTKLLSHSDAPDGGWEAWSVVLGAWCASFCSFGWINSVGTFQEYYESGPLKEYSPSVIAWIPSLQIFFLSAMGPFTGKLFDMYGPRMIILVGSIMHVFGLAMASLSTKYYQFLLSQGVCSAIGIAAVFLTSTACLSGWFHKKRGTAFGVMATGSSVGGVVFPIMVRRLIDKVGYGWAMRSVDLVILVLLIVNNLTVRCRYKPAKRKLLGKSLSQPFREITFVLLLAGLFLVPFGLFIPIDFLPTVSIRAGMSKDLAQMLVAFYNASSLIGRLGSGYLSDKFGKFNMYITGCYGAGILILALWIPATAAGASVAFAVLFGIFSGAYIALSNTLPAQISPLEDIGYRSGVVQMVASVGGLCTNPIAGAIMESRGGLVGLKVFAGTMLVSGTTFVVFARISRTGFTFKKVF